MSKCEKVIDNKGGRVPVRCVLFSVLNTEPNSDCSPLMTIASKLLRLVNVPHDGQLIARSFRMRLCEGSTGHGHALTNLCT